MGLEYGEVEARVAARRQLKAGANCLKIMATGGYMTPGTKAGRIVAENGVLLD